MKGSSSPKSPAQLSMSTRPALNGRRRAHERPRASVSNDVPVRLLPVHRRVRLTSGIAIATAIASSSLETPDYSSNDASRGATRAWVIFTACGTMVPDGAFLPLPMVRVRFWTRNSPRR